jgi:DNA-binding response OmpR family regulator
MKMSALCERCREEIAVADDYLDRAGDIDRDRRVVMVAGVGRRLAPTHWRLFVLLYCSRGDVVNSDRAYDELYRNARNPRRPHAINAHVGYLRRALDGSRYQIETRLAGTGYELVIDDPRGAPQVDQPLGQVALDGNAVAVGNVDIRAARQR